MWEFQNKYRFYVMEILKTKADMSNKYITFCNESLLNLPSRSTVYLVLKEFDFFDFCLYTLEVLWYTIKTFSYMQLENDIYHRKACFRFMCRIVHN